ncbi:MAG: 3-methyl-2-oxobutanoate hydroxymethyltransferase, partial [Patescibacteria group bacterium]|nr:3-methyl-2-oxobutanoate hydroxymethyltransferase [Patescibacteria group bacterium]
YQSMHQVGGYHTMGETEPDIKRLIEEARALEEAGAFAIVVEKVTVKAAEEITKSVLIPTIGIGAGNKCDGQILVTPDMLGMNPEFKPKFLRHYAELKSIMLSAFQQYQEDVKKGKYPADEESY